MTYTPDCLRTLFQSSFNLTKWYSFLQHLFNATELKSTPEKIIDNSINNGYYLGYVNTTDNHRIGLFHYNVKKDYANKRVVLRNLVKSYITPVWSGFDAALVVFDSGDLWRLSFIYDINGEAISPKRYTYVFGSDGLPYRTPIERFNFLKKKGVSFENLKTAFSVEALSDEFFGKYREQYADLIQYITGKRFVKVGSKWEERVIDTPNLAMMQAFDHNEKKIRDYVKKMMIRIAFLHFLQRKGWMCGDLNYMQNMFENSPYKNDYLASVLEPLFFGILNTKPAERETMFTDYEWDKSLLNEWKDIPYLNGGLFERDEDDEPEIRFPAELFKRLFQFFSEYNFTIDENDPNDAEVGVDPEMLGKIFENLLEDNKDKGAFYTPKEIVRYMCQESIIAYLETNTSIGKEKIRQFVLSPEEGVADIPENKKPKLIAALEEVKICDPAIGSGAFPMGLLNELLHCREVLSGEHYDRAEIKKSIIQNNIYGVDIEKGAVDITRLRFWLSIVVDERTPSPLPNLDYKIMQGNSLIENFMRANLNDVFSREGKEGFDIVIGNPPYIGEKGHKEIFQSVKADIHLGQYYLGKMDYFYFFFHLAFNILALNGIATFITTNYYLTASGARKLRADIKDRMNIRTLFNLGELRLFDKARGQHNIISIFSKRKDICKCQIINVHKKGVINPQMFASIISHKEKNTTYIEIPQKDLYDGKENYIRILNSCGDNPLSSLLHKIQSGNNTLGNIAEVNAGIMGGCDSITGHNIKYADTNYIQSNDIRKDDGVFVLDCNFFRDRSTIHLIKKYKFYKEFYKNSDINRYCTNEATGKRLIFSSSDTPLDEQEIIKSTLSKYRTILTKIREINNEKKEYWYQLRRGTAHPHIFTNAKIVCPQRSKTNTFGYNECDWYASADVYYITNPNKEYHIKYLLGLLNSKLYYVWLYHKGKRKGEILELYQKPLSEIPIKKVSPDVQNSIIKIVDMIITLKKCNPNHNTSSLEQKIDTIVYDIYELSDIEIEIIEKTVKK